MAYLHTWPGEDPQWPVISDSIELHTRLIVVKLSPIHDCSAFKMKWPNSNQFANCSHSVQRAHLFCLCKHVSKTKELELPGKVETNQRIKIKKAKKIG